MISRSYIAITGGLGLRAAALALLVMVLARSLGSSLYGGYAAVLSISNLFATFSGLGAAILHVRDASRQSLSHDVSLRRATIQTLRTFIPLAVVCLACTWLLIPTSIPHLPISAIAIGELSAVIATELAFRSFQAQERYWAMGVATAFVPLLRTIVAGSMWFLGMLDLYTWAPVSLASGLLPLAGLVVLFMRRTSTLNRGAVSNKISAADALSGVGYSLSAASAQLHGDADKIVLARLTTTADTGQYAVAYRLTDVLTLPIVAAIARLLPSLFRDGTTGFSASIKQSRKLISVGLVAALFLSIIGYLAAPLLPWILGSSYTYSVRMARALAFIPFSMTVWSIVRSIAGTSGYEKEMGATELSGATFNIVACIVGVAAFGWAGAVIATYLTHLFMAVALVTWIRMRERGMAASGSSFNK